MYKLINVTNLRSLYKIINYTHYKNSNQLLEINKHLLSNYNQNNNNDWKLILNHSIIKPHEFKKIDINFKDIERKKADLSLLYYPPNHIGQIQSHYNTCNLSMILDGAFIYQEYKDGLSYKKTTTEYIKKGDLKISTKNYNFHNYKCDISCCSVLLSINFDRIN